MTKIVLKLNCGDSNPPFLAENLPFLENVFGLPFLLCILLAKKDMFPLFNQSF